MSRFQCVVFWKLNGKEFTGGATLECDEAEAYVQRRNQAMGRGSHWFRKILVNADIDIVSQCRDPDSPAEGVPASPAKKI